MKLKKSKIFSLVMIFLLYTLTDHSAQLEISRHLISSGGTIIGHAEYGIRSSVGQPIIDFASGNENNLWLGFWNADQFLVDVNDKELLPEKFEIFQNFPNPFNPSTKIKYSIPQLSKVKLEIFSILGERVSVLVDEEQERGYFITEFNASNIASGIYFYRIYAESLNEGKKNIFNEVKKMILLK